MITEMRVGIPITGGEYWFAGVTITESLVRAVNYLPKNERPQLFLVVTDDTLGSFGLHQPFISLFNGIIFVGQSQTDASKIIASPYIYCASQDELFSKIDFLFPLNSVVWPDRCAAVWIPDFQHRYLPEFFSPAECACRDERFGNIAQLAQLIVFTTNTVKQDFVKFYPSSQAVTRVLAAPFYPEEEWYTGDPVEIQNKYGLPDRFIMCSNQFWIHKNHAILFNAIALLRQAGQDVHLVCTGFTFDYRWPDYFTQIEQQIEKLGITDLVHILGLIPRRDQVQLIRRSLFVIQPSMFEGLSMIVLECQALGKKIILSDLDVHREHEYGIYFERANPQDLAQKISDLLPASQPGPHLPDETKARCETIIRLESFAREFCNLIEESQIIFHRITPTPQINLSFNPKDDITVVTSLVPDDFNNQQAAIASWTKAGFRVVAINAPNEIAIIQPHFPDIEFVETKRDARGKYRNPYPFFDDLLAYLATQPSRICGIIKSDIYLFKPSFYSFVHSEAPDSFILGSRLDIKSLNDAAPGTMNEGFDYFFFDKALIRHYPQEEFCFGLSWWDYWAPLVPLASKRPVKRITSPIAYHIIHPGRIPNPLIPWRDFAFTLSKHVTPLSPLSASNDRTILEYQFFIYQTILKHSLDVPFE